MIYEMSSPSVSPSAATVSTTHVDNMLKNYRHDQIVHALMTQLREKEAEMAAFSEQRQRLQRKIDLDYKALDEKNKKIALLEKNLAQEKNLATESKKTQATLKHITETNAVCQRIIREREDELLQLKPTMKELKEKVDEYENQEHVLLIEQLGGELTQTREELTVTEDTNTTSKIIIEDLEKKVRGKQWMVKSLQDDSVVQRSRESHLLAHIEKLNEKIETYEEKFQGRGVDVPILLAKLKDYEIRVKHLQGKVRMLTNKKLNEKVTRTSGTSRISDRNEARQDEVESMSKVSSDSFFAEHSDEEEEGTFASNASDDMDDHFQAPSAQEKSFLGDIISDFKVGIESLKVDLCCAQEKSMNKSMASPLSEISPSSFDSCHDSQGSPSSHTISCTFTAGSPSNELNKSR